MDTYQFGFLAKRVTYRFSGGKITPITQFGDAKKWIARYAHMDGFLYPPLVASKSEQGEREANTERPSQLHRVPASHELEFDVEPPAEDRHRLNASVIVQLVAYLHGTWLSFADWWFDARVPLGGTHELHCSAKIAEHFLSHAYRTWRGWPEPVKRRFTNSLYMLNRAPAYEWDWEHFMHEYMVLDACYRTAVDIGLVAKEEGHEKRIQQLCTVFKIPQNPDLTKRIVDLRKDLFHETLWDGGQPGTPGSASSFHAPLNLRRLNQRLVLAILGYNNDYMRSRWWYMGHCPFRIPE